jgi:hypothetical protein
MDSKKPKRKRSDKRKRSCLELQVAGVRPEDLGEDEERRKPHSTTNSPRSPPHRQDTLRDLGMGKIGEEDKIGEENNGAGRGHRALYFPPVGAPPPSWSVLLRSDS